MQLPEGRSGSVERFQTPQCKGRNETEKQCGGKSNACSTSRTELAFLIFFSLFSKLLQADTCVAVSHVSRQSHRNYSVLNQWTRAVLRKLGNDKATAGERRAITSKLLPFNALCIQMSRRSLTFLWQIISKHCDRAWTAIPALLPSGRRKFPRCVDEGAPISPVSVLRHSVFVIADFLYQLCHAIFLMEGPALIQ